jgi:predicted HD phosphohydrolase
MLDQTVDFVHMADGTREDYALLEEISKAHPIPVAENIIGLLNGLKGNGDGFKVDRYQHSLQTATRAHNEGADEEMVMVTLLHDIGDMLAPANHSAFAASVLRPYISEENHWIVQHHGVFQGYYYFHHYDLDRDAREQFRGHAQFQACADFCEKWDQTSFDPDYETMPLEAFVPMVHRLVENRKERWV